jgi:deoxyribose-phosphate aldolase
MTNYIVVANGGIIKVIFENDYLEDEYIIRLCQICSKIGVAFVKTSARYGFVKYDNGMYLYQGATSQHLKLMREHCPDSVRIKAAGFMDLG